MKRWIAAMCVCGTVGAHDVEGKYSKLHSLPQWQEVLSLQSPRHDFLILRDGTRLFGGLERLPKLHYPFGDLSFGLDEVAVVILSGQKIQYITKDGQSYLANKEECPFCMTIADATQDIDPQNVKAIVLKERTVGSKECSPWRYHLVMTNGDRVVVEMLPGLVTVSDGVGDVHIDAFSIADFAQSGFLYAAKGEGKERLKANFVRDRDLEVHVPKLGQSVRIRWDQIARVTRQDFDSSDAIVREAISALEGEQSEGLMPGVVINSAGAGTFDDHRSPIAVGLGHKGPVLKGGFSAAIVPASCIEKALQTEQHILVDSVMIDSLIDYLAGSEEEDEVILSRLAHADRDDYFVSLAPEKLLSLKEFILGKDNGPEKSEGEDFEYTESEDEISDNDLPDEESDDFNFSRVGDDNDEPQIVFALTKELINEVKEHFTQEEKKLAESLEPEEDAPEVDMALLQEVVQELVLPEPIDVAAGMEAPEPLELSTEAVEILAQLLSDDEEESHIAYYDEQPARAFDREYSGQIGAKEVPMALVEAEYLPHLPGPIQSQQDLKKSNLQGTIIPTSAIHTVMIRMPSYYIDKKEVSNQDYQQFVQETGHPAPKHWKKEQYPQNQADAPVVNVSYRDAEAYAAWAGKRLPTSDEWVRAADAQLIEEDGTINEWALISDDQQSRMNFDQRLRFDADKDHADMNTGFRCAR